MRIVFIKGADLIARKSRSSIVVHRGDGSYKEVNIRDIEAIVVMGSKTKVEAGVVSLLSRYNIPVSLVNWLGVSILTTPVVTLYSETRRAQYMLNDDEKAEIMLRILVAKFRGFTNILKYHEKEAPEMNVNEGLVKCDLLRWEATTSRRYWQLLFDLIPGDLMDELQEKYGFQGRKPRAKDPLNQSISVLYATLYSIASRALLASGLDPTHGLHHKTRYSVPLVYDYAEMYKPIAVHAVIKLIRRTGRLPRLDEDGYLDKESLNLLLREFFNIMKARIRGTRLTPHRAVYLNAFRLATAIRRDNKGITYTYTYNPKKLIHPRNR